MSSRKMFLLISILSMSALIYAIYVQVYQHIAACPLCIAQRIIFGLIGILALLFAFHKSRKWIVFIESFIISGMSVFGMVISGKHIWIINLPIDKQPVSCGMPLNVLYEQLPLSGFLSYIFHGDAECGRIAWRIFNIPAPFMSFGLYVALLTLSIYTAFTTYKTNS